MIQGLQSLASARLQRSTASTLGAGFLVPSITRTEPLSLFERTIVTFLEKCKAVPHLGSSSLNFGLLPRGCAEATRLTDPATPAGRASTPGKATRMHENLHRTMAGEEP